MTVLCDLMPAGDVCIEHAAIWKSYNLPKLVCNVMLRALQAFYDKCG
jgi:hypothetical protein